MCSVVNAMLSTLSLLSFLFFYISFFIEVNSDINFCVQIWGTLIMQKKYKGPDYFLAVLVTLGCSLFILFPVSTTLYPFTFWKIGRMSGNKLIFFQL